MEDWIFRKIGGTASGSHLTRDALRQYQAEKLRETVAYAGQNSPFYRARLADFPVETLQTPEDVSRLPFTTAQDIRKAPLKFLCVSQSDISRMVTLKTSGTTANPKRLCFTAQDLELTVDFFAHAMRSFVKPGQRVLILLPGEQPDSVGDLLRRGLDRIGVDGIVSGPVADPAQTADTILKQEIDGLVGIPTQVLQLVRTDGVKKIPAGRIKSVILSTDYVPEAVKKTLESAWGCRVFNHYGMTEMGYGGGVECHAQCGYHFRDADLLMEIVDPATGQPKQDGEYGEAVFTTLTRHGMPLIRYRTGDLTRFLPDPCPCGTVLKRMEPVRGRIAGSIALKNGQMLTVRDLDERLLTLPELLNYQAEITRENGLDLLRISVYTSAGNDPQLAETIRQTVSGIPAIQAALNESVLSVGEIQFSPENWFTTGMKKRKIEDRR
ncbi:DVU_1553 family AMP-dependent CoA ligase [Desulfonema ishimotonii]|nr:AMP-binding protein [Desulfonema ishimotonii]